MSAGRTQRYPWLFEERARPNAIAHRGASDYAHQNSIAAFRKAAILGADFWEVDVRTTSDGVLVAQHDPDLSGICEDETEIGNMPWNTVLRLSTNAGLPVCQLTDVLDLALQHGAGLYIDAKDKTALDKTPELLRHKGLERCVIACFDLDPLRELASSGCHFPLAVLVPPGKDPIEMVRYTGADIVHLCWEHAAARPQELVTPALLESFAEHELATVLWHEERRDVMAELSKLPVFGICSNQPELANPYRVDQPASVQIVCHRGANTVCPENTLSGATCAFNSGYQFVELDVRETADGELVVVHDSTVDRTSSGAGLVKEHSLQSIQALDAGSWFDQFFQHERIPHFSDMLALAYQRQGGLYIELKNADALTVLRLTEHHQMLDRSFFWSADPDLLSAIRRASRHARLMTRRKDFDTLHDAIRYVESDIIEFDALTDNLDELTDCRQSGVKCMIAYMGKESSVMARIARLSPDLLNCNHPDEYRRQARQLRKLLHR